MRGISANNQSVRHRLENTRIDDGSLLGILVITAVTLKTPMQMKRWSASHPFPPSPKDMPTIHLKSIHLFQPEPTVPGETSLIHIDLASTPAA